MRLRFDSFTATNDHLRYLLGFVGYTAWYFCMIVGFTRIGKDALYNHMLKRGFEGQLGMVIKIVLYLLALM